VYILEVTPFPDFKAEANGADRSKMPTPGAPPELKLPKLQRSTLSNGLKVILAERHEVPLVNLRWRLMRDMRRINWRHRVRRAWRFVAADGRYENDECVANQRPTGITGAQIQCWFESGFVDSASLFVEIEIR